MAFGPAAFLMACARRGQRVLDIGCGEGAFAAGWRAGAEVVGLDVAEEPLRRARAAHPGLDLRLLCSDARWELPDASFDVVWAGEVIEHVADTAGWLSEAAPCAALGRDAPAQHPRDRAAGAAPSRPLAAGLRERFDPRADHLRFYSTEHPPRPAGGVRLPRGRDAARGGSPRLRLLPRLSGRAFERLAAAVAAL